jgi:hypothetical protein
MSPAFHTRREDSPARYDPRGGRASVDPARVHFFDRDTGQVIRTRPAQVPTST